MPATEAALVPSACERDGRSRPGRVALPPMCVRRCATGSSRYLAMGEEMVRSLNAVARVPNGFAGIKSVINMQQEVRTPCVA